MLQHVLLFLVSVNYFSTILCHNYLAVNNSYENVITTKNFLFWPNATVPFYVNADHFDHEQSLSILTALSMFAFKTCIKFHPVMAPPVGNEEVLVFQNPGGVRRCNVDTVGHSVFEPHVVTLGYDCLKSPDIDMTIMKSLGFPFEHNRINRDLFINVLFENIEPGAIELFAKEDKLPAELRYLPYDVNSVMHFGAREFSKNGHRTILFKDHNVQQNRVGLTPTDLKKIEIVYGPECRKRDRQEKIELCQSYPGGARKKREADHSTVHQTDPARKKRDVDDVEFVTKSLRVNPDITPPAESIDGVTRSLKDLGIEEEVQTVVEQVYNLSALALRNAREKYCNDSKPHLRTGDVKVTRNSSDILGIIQLVSEYAKDVVDNAVANLTKFCEESESLDIYQRSGCSWHSGDPRCRQIYKSTKTGNVRYSTQHRPTYIQSTKHHGINKAMHRPYVREGNDTGDVEVTTVAARQRRQAETKTADENVKRDDTEVVSGTAEPNENEKVIELKSDSKVNSDKKESLGVKQSNDDHRRSIQGKRHRVKHERGERGRHGEVSTSESEESKVSFDSEQPKKKRHRKEHTNKEEIRHSMKKKLKEIRERKIKHKDDSAEFYENTEQGKKDESVAESAEMEREVVVKERFEKKGRVRKPKPDERKQESGESQETRQKPKSEKKLTKDSVPKTVTMSKANAEFYSERKWLGGFVPYIIQEDTTYDLEDMRQRIEEVNRVLTRKTCVRLKEITEGEADKYEDYIVIDNSPDYVTGKVGGRQKFGSIELFRGGQHRQHAAMMIMAMLGFYFEVSRHDRDKYIRVHMRHVRPDKIHHFEKIREDATLPLPYDYASATHPAWQFWRQLGKTGISTVATYKQQDPDGAVMKSLGQNEKIFSDTDIVKINTVYGVECFQNARNKNEYKSKHKEGRT